MPRTRIEEIEDTALKAIARRRQELEQLSASLTQSKDPQEQAMGALFARYAQKLADEKTVERLLAHLSGGVRNASYSYGSVGPEAWRASIQGALNMHLAAVEGGEGGLPQGVPEGVSFQLASGRFGATPGALNNSRKIGSKLDKHLQKTRHKVALELGPDGQPRLTGQTGLTLPPKNVVHS